MRARALVASLVMVMATISGCASPAPAPTSTTAPSLMPSPTPTLDSLEALTAEEILASSIAALKAAPSFHLRASATAGSITQVSDVDYVRSNAKGTQTILGQVTEFVRVGKYMYVKGGDGYWYFKLRLQQIALVSGKWVKVDATSPNHSGLAPSVDRMVSSVGALTKVGPSNLDGKPVITLKSADGSTIHVSAQGEPYPLRIEGTASTSEGALSAVLDFTQFGTVTTIIEAPTGAIVDLSTS